MTGNFVVIVPPLPKGHDKALHAAAKELSDYVNELPESVYHLSPDDAETAAGRVITTYLAELERQQ